MSKTDYAWMKSIRARVLSINMVRWIGIQFIFYCDYLASRFEYFNLIKIEVFAMNHETEKEILDKLKQIKLIDIELVKLMQLIREYFKWMLLFNITTDVMDITIDVEITQKKNLI